MGKKLNFKELSKKLGNRSRSSIYRDVKNRGFPSPIALGRILYWDEDAVDKYLEELAKVPYTPTPVRRDHPCKTESIEIVTNTVMKEVPENTIIDSFMKKMRKAGLTPPMEIIADGNVHLIHTSSGTEYYALHPESPAIGLYGCEQRDIQNIWPNKHQVEEMNDIEKAAYKKKAKQMRRLRDKTLSANQTS